MMASSAAFQSAEASEHALPGHGAFGAVAGKRFYIETFGCQMNAHDSEKVAGVLLGRGYRAALNPAEADLMLYNTCSIREKAAQKVFSRLGEWRGRLEETKSSACSAAWRSRKAKRFSSARLG